MPSFQNLPVEYLINPYTPDDGNDIRFFLSQPQKSLAPRYFYDERGSQLFEEICTLPEYYLTRTEESILQEYARKIPHLTKANTIIELGSGSSKKTRHILDAYQNSSIPLRYLPIDVSPTILEASIYTLLQSYSNLDILGLVSSYDLALQKLKSYTSPTRLVGFLGSSLGNFNPQECDRFFEQLSFSLDQGDYFLLGVDLAKSKDILEPAYNDAQGVTANFNLNILAHLNWRFRGNFDLNLFKHQAIYNQALSQMEMYLIALAPHSVNLDALDLKLDFQLGETILTEISRKFHLDQLQKQLQNHSFEPLEVWQDSDRRFALILSRRG